MKTGVCSLSHLYSIFQLSCWYSCRSLDLNTFCLETMKSASAILCSTYICYTHDASFRDFIFDFFLQFWSHIQSFRFTFSPWTCTLSSKPKGLSSTSPKLPTHYTSGKNTAFLVWCVGVKLALRSRDGEEWRAEKKTACQTSELTCTVQSKIYWLQSRFAMTLAKGYSVLWIWERKKFCRRPKVYQGAAGVESCKLWQQSKLKLT